MQRNTILLITGGLSAVVIGALGITGNLTWVGSSLQGMGRAWAESERQDDAERQQANDDYHCNYLATTHVIGQEDAERVEARNHGCPDPFPEPTPPPTQAQTDAELTPQQAYAAADELHRSITERIRQATTENRVDVGGDVNRMLTLYLRALPAGSFVSTDLELAVRELDEIDRTTRTDRVANVSGASLVAQLRLFMEAWNSDTAPKAVLRPILTRIRDRLTAQSRARGFNPAHRYTSQEVMNHQCDEFGDNIGPITELSLLLEPTSAATRQWQFQRAETYRLFGCESSGEVDYSGMEAAYNDYVASGHPGDGLPYARELAQRALGIYANGYDCNNCEDEAGNYAPTRFPAGSEEELERAKTWLVRLPATERVRLLRETAEAAVQGRRFEIAATLYREAGDARNVARVTALATGSQSQNDS